MSDKTDKKYKWANPHEWLLDKIDNEWTPEEIQAFARQAARTADSDDIQDEFQSDMDADGYFDPLCPHGHFIADKSCEECGEIEESEAV